MLKILGDLVLLLAIVSGAILFATVNINYPPDEKSE